MQMRLRIRQRSPRPTPWKWEICLGDHLVTASHESFTSQDDAYGAGRPVLDRLVAEADRTATSYVVRDGCMIPKPTA
jgi:hypothetical protein